VLKKITLDTGIKIKLNDQGSGYLINASIENMPLHRGLKLILRRLNHAIVYESDKSIKIMVYGTDSDPIQSFSPHIQGNQQGPIPSPESSHEKADDLKRAGDSSEETDSSENTDDKSTENKDSSDNGKKESSEETGAAAGKELDHDSSGQRENTNEQKNAAEYTPPKSSQEQN
jgi:hypothetical protein